MPKMKAFRVTYRMFRPPGLGELTVICLATNQTTLYRSCGPFFMGNKGAVGIRFTVRDTADDAGEIYT